MTCAGQVWLPCSTSRRSPFAGLALQEFNGAIVGLVENGRRGRYACPRPNTLFAAYSDFVAMLISFHVHHCASITPLALSAFDRRAVSIDASIARVISAKMRIGQADAWLRTPRTIPSLHGSANSFVTGDRARPEKSRQPHWCAPKKTASVRPVL